MFLFACIEGEVALLTAGFLCHQGMMSLYGVILAAFLGTVVTEQSLFCVGHFYGDRILKKYPKIASKSAKVIEFLKKYDSIFIFGSRFVYGIRNISPIIIGVAKISPKKFAVLNIPAAFIWAVAVACTGYLCSNVLALAKDHVDIAGIVCLLILCVSFLYFVTKKKKKRR